MLEREAQLSPDVLETPLLHGLDDLGKKLILGAATLRRLNAGEALFSEGSPADTFFVVLRGALELRAVCRGDVNASLIRMAHRGDMLGEDAVLPNARRSGTASALKPSSVLEVSMTLFR